MFRQYELLTLLTLYHMIPYNFIIIVFIFVTWSQIMRSTTITIIGILLMMLRRSEMRAMV